MAILPVVQARPGLRISGVDEVLPERIIPGHERLCRLELSGLIHRRMATTNKRLALIAASTFGFVVLCFAVLVLLMDKPKPAVDADQIFAAVTNFCAAHKPLPPTVTFSQLIAQGYLGSNVLHEFGASEVTVSSMLMKPTRKWF